MKRIRWTLLQMLFLTGAVGCTLASVTTFGIAVTLTAWLILAASRLVFARTRDVRQKSQVLGLTVVLLYVCTFLAFRVFRTIEFPLAHWSDPEHNIVIFSLEPTAQQWARYAYYPLIKCIPGHCAYPTGAQMKLLNHSPFTGKRYALYW